MNTISKINPDNNTQKLNLFVNFLQKNKSLILMSKKNDFFAEKYTFQTNND